MMSLESTLRDFKPVAVEPLAVSGKTGNVTSLRYSNGVRVVVRVGRDKTAKGYKTQGSLPLETQPAREAAFYALAKLLGFSSLVPETIVYKSSSGRAVSFQMFVNAMRPHDIEKDMDREEIERDEWRAAAKRALRNVDDLHWKQAIVLDIVAGSRDRHLNNVGIRVSIQKNKVVHSPVLWDNGVSFGLAFERYRNVPHKLLYGSSADLSEVLAPLEKLSIEQFQEALGVYISPEEICHAYLRLKFACLYPQRLPWKYLTREGGADRFPLYRNFFSSGVDSLKCDATRKSNAS